MLLAPCIHYAFIDAQHLPEPLQKQIRTFREDQIQWIIIYRTSLTWVKLPMI